MSGPGPAVPLASVILLAPWLALTWRGRATAGPRRRRFRRAAALAVVVLLTAAALTTCAAGSDEDGELPVRLRGGRRSRDGRHSGRSPDAGHQLARLSNVQARACEIDRDIAGNHLFRDHCYQQHGKFPQAQLYALNSCFLRPCGQNNTEHCLFSRATHCRWKNNDPLMCQEGCILTGTVVRIIKVRSAHQLSTYTSHGQAMGCVGGARPGERRPRRERSIALRHP